MKTTFNSLDLAASVLELKGLVGMRINQIYDIDHKTYIFRLQKPNQKMVLLVESGSRIHSTTYAWPKSACPSGFTMKLRKHLTNKRLESIEQLGNDRIVIMQFGTDAATHYLIAEFFQRGNIVLTDNNMVILSVLTPHKETNVRFAAREIYPMERAHKKLSPPTFEDLIEMKSKASKDITVHKSLLTLIDFGTSLIEHALVYSDLAKNTKFINSPDDKLKILAENLIKAEEIFMKISTEGSKGFIIKNTVKNLDGTELENFLEFHPYLFKQHESSEFTEFENFNMAVDDYFSKIESQSIELKAVVMQNEYLNKVEKIKKNQDSRIQELTMSQESSKTKAELIMCNSDVVDEAIYIINSALASQMDWSSIDTMVKNAQSHKEPIALMIHSLNFLTNHMTLLLRDVYEESQDSEPISVEVDLALSAHANAKQYYNHKKYAAQKEKKTLESQDKALISAQKKAKTALKEIKTLTSIKKVLKPYWFEKFYWFISSENYLVIGGRDQAQNELVVKRYMNAGDLYVHADIHGASNVIIKNPTGKSVPIKTLNEAGTMAVCCSVGWDAKILCSAWWVTHEQVSKTAPTGEYLQTGSFMVRGHKTYLLPAQLAMGCGFLFRVSDSCAERHKDERKVRNVQETCEKIADLSVSQSSDVVPDDVEDIVAPKTSKETSPAQDKSSKGDSEFPDEDFEAITLSSKEDEDESFASKDLDKIDEEDDDEEEDEDDELDENNEDDKDSLVDKEEPSLSTDKKSKKTPPKMNKNQDKGDEESKKQATFKRGQKSKLKKIKEKYKDQDDEEKKLRMLVLASAGEKKLTKKEKRNMKNQKPKPVDKTGFKKPQNPTTVDEKPEDLDDPELKVPTDLDALEVLTGQPHPDDELLYSIPVIAPYNTLLNYKFKLKLVPGTTKKGKAAKLAVETFIRNEECTPRERDLIKTVDFQKFAANFPGKVKISIPVASKKKKHSPKPIFDDI